MVNTVTAVNFEKEVLESDVPVLVDFWAAWCTPCKMLSPIVDEAAKEREDVKFCKVNIDQESELAMRYGVMSIPTLIAIQKRSDSKEVHRPDIKRGTSAITVETGDTYEDTCLRRSEGSEQDNN